MFIRLLSRRRGLVRFDLHAVNRSRLPTPEIVKSGSRRVFRRTPAA